MTKRLSYDYVKGFINDRGFCLVDRTYKNVSTKMLMNCPEGHSFKMTFDSFSRGYGCPVCSHRAKYTYDEVCSIFNREGFEVLDREYVGANSPLQVKCSNGHSIKLRLSDFLHGVRCSTCSGIAKKDVASIRESLTLQGYQLLSTSYTNNKSKLLLKCPENHVFEMRWNDFQQGHRCPQCVKGTSVSVDEKDVLSLVRSIYTGVIVENDRSIIMNPSTGCYLELDIWLPEINKAIEYNGDYWHQLSEMIKNDTLKRKICSDLNILLLTITESEWKTNRDTVVNKIKTFVR